MKTRTWNMQIKGKLKHFIWRCYHNILPTKTQLARKYLQGHQICAMCGERDETLEHIFSSVGERSLCGNWLQWSGRNWKRKLNIFYGGGRAVFPKGRKKLWRQNPTFCLHFVDVVENLQPVGIQWLEENGEESSRSGLGRVEWILWVYSEENSWRILTCTQHKSAWRAGDEFYGRVYYSVYQCT